MPTGELRLNAEQYLMNTYTRQPISIVRGRGSKVYDLEGREYIDFVAGIAVNLLGHGHPDLVLPIQKQVQHLIHTSNLYYTEPQVRLAQTLVEHSFAQKVFFCKSGDDELLSRAHHGHLDRHRSGEGAEGIRSAHAGVFACDVQRSLGSRARDHIENRRRPVGAHSG